MLYISKITAQISSVSFQKSTYTDSPMLCKYSQVKSEVWGLSFYLTGSSAEIADYEISKLL